MFCDDSFCCVFFAYASPFWRGVSFSLKTYGETPNRDLFLSYDYEGNPLGISREKEEPLTMCSDYERSSSREGKAG